MIVLELSFDLMQTGKLVDHEQLLRTYADLFSAVLFGVTDLQVEAQDYHLQCLFAALMSACLHTQMQLRMCACVAYCAPLAECIMHNTDQSQHQSWPLILQFPVQFPDPQLPSSQSALQSHRC